MESLGEGRVRDLDLRNIGFVGEEHIFKDLFARMLDPSHGQIRNWDSSMAGTDCQAVRFNSFIAARLVAGPHLIQFIDS